MHAASAQPATATFTDRFVLARLSEEYGANIERVEAAFSNELAALEAEIPSGDARQLAVSRVRLMLFKASLNGGIYTDLPR